LSDKIYPNAKLHMTR